MRDPKRQKKTTRGMLKVITNLQFDIYEAIEYARDTVGHEVELLFIPLSDTVEFRLRAYAYGKYHSIMFLLTSRDFELSRVDYTWLKFRDACSNLGRYIREAN